MEFWDWGLKFYKLKNIFKFKYKLKIFQKNIFEIQKENSKNRKHFEKQIEK